MRRKKYSFIWFGSLAVVLSLIAGVVWVKWQAQQQILISHLVLPDQSQIEVEIADTFVKQQRGLMGRNYLDPEHGMLFVFSTPVTYEFWMKDTFVELDYVWLRDGVVQEVTQHVPPGAGLSEDQIARVKPQEPVDWVLEVPAGFVQEHQIQVGDTLRLDE